MEGILRRVADRTSPLLVHEVERVVRRLRHGALPAALLIVPALLALAIVARLLEASGAAPLLSANLLPALPQFLALQVFALAVVVPLGDGAASLLRFLRGDQFEQLLMTRTTRAELTLTLWHLTFLRALVWSGFVLGVQLVALVVLLPVAQWHDAAAVFGVAFVGAAAPLAVSTSLVVNIAMRRRTVAALAVEGLPRLLLLYPVLFCYALILFVCALLIFLAPLVSLGGALLYGIAPPRLLYLPGGVLILALAVAYVAFLCSVLVRMNLAQAERWCVPDDWIDRWRQPAPRPSRPCGAR